MIAVNVTEFRRHLPDYLKLIQQGDEVQLTNRGRVIARVIPEVDAAEAARRRLFDLREQGRVGDIISPIDGPHAMQIVP